MKQKLKLGISPCPNDTYIYENLISGLKNSPFDWDVLFADVETLNEMVLRNQLDVAKVSAGVLPFISENYEMLSCGGAVGYSCGPLLLSSQGDSLDFDAPVLLPGKWTTAALLFDFYLESRSSKNVKREFLVFNEVYERLRSKEAVQGVVIHEHRFTYKKDGLFLVDDLGAFFEEKTNSPVPLGVAVLSKKRSALREDVEAEIKQSLSLAKSREELVSPFIREHARSLDTSVIEAHIRAFVTDFSYHIGESGAKAMEALKRLRRALPRRE